MESEVIHIHTESFVVTQLTGGRYAGEYVAGSLLEPDVTLGAGSDPMSAASAALTWVATNGWGKKPTTRQLFGSSPRPRQRPERQPDPNRPAELTVVQRAADRKPKRVRDKESNVTVEHMTARDSHHCEAVPCVQSTSWITAGAEYIAYVDLLGRGPFVRGRVIPPTIKLHYGCVPDKAKRATDFLRKVYS